MKLCYRYTTVFFAEFLKQQALMAEKVVRRIILKFIVLEIGSTNTKAKLYDSGKIKDLGFKQLNLKIILKRMAK